MGLGVMAVSVFIAASCAMNAHFWLNQGKTELEGQILAAVSVAADIFKALLPFLIASAFAGRRIVQGSVGAGLFLLILAFSLGSSLGFAALNRGAVTGSREAINARLEAVKAELSEMDTRISKIGDIQDIQIVEAAIAKQKQDIRWTSSKQCSDATAAKSRDFCAEYFNWQGKLAAATSGKLLIERRAQLRKDLVNVKAAGGGEASDPQASLLARLIPVGDATDMQMMMIVLITIMVELTAAFGLWLATGGLAAKRKEPVATLAPAPAANVSAPVPSPMPFQMDVVPPSRRLERPHRTGRVGRTGRELTVVSEVEKQLHPERFRLEDAEVLLQSPAG